MHGPVRTRLTAAALSAATITAGLAARAALTGPLAKHLGVALWAALVYWLILLIRPTTRIPTAALLTLTISWTVEFAQLTPIPDWLSSQHTILRLIFGTTFHWPDLPAYAAGVLLAAAAHRLILPTSRGRIVYPPQP
jgi:hypothetical protein